MPTFAAMKIIVSKEIGQVCPTFVGACVEAKVVNTPFSEALWKEIDALCEHYRATLTTETLKEMSSIAATRSVYKACGKDPSRYRPASTRRNCPTFETGAFCPPTFLPLA